MLHARERTSAREREEARERSIWRERGELQESHVGGREEIKGEIGWQRSMVRNRKDK